MQRRSECRERPLSHDLRIFPHFSCELRRAKLRRHLFIGKIGNFDRIRTFRSSRTIGKFDTWEYASDFAGSTTIPLHGRTSLLRRDGSSVMAQTRFQVRLTMALCLLFPCVLATSSQAQGIIIPGGGAIHRAMGGVSTAAPVDAIGAVYWNPAAPSRLAGNEIGVGGEMIYPTIDVTSNVPGGLEGRTRSDSGLGMISDVGLVYHVNEDVTASMGLLTTAGGGVNFPGDPSNPVLAPIGPNGQFVLGPQYSSMTIVQVMPALSVNLTENLVIGVGPTISAALVSFSPAFFGGPNDANGDGLSSFPDGSGTRPYWGGGFRVGAVCHLTQDLDFGFAYNSRTWFETWKFYAKDEVGVPQTLTLDANLPATFSWGLAYSGLERWLLATDLRYLDYEDADLFGQSIADSGLNWSSVFAAAFGARYQWSDRLALMGGYIYNDNPVPTVGTLFNVQAPAVMQHSLSVGASADLTESIILSMAYVHAFRNTVSGEPLQAVGAGLTLGAEADSVVVGINIRFGCKGACASACRPSCDCASASCVCASTSCGGGTPMACGCPEKTCRCPAGDCHCPPKTPSPEPAPISPAPAAPVPDAKPTTSLAPTTETPSSTAILEDTGAAVAAPLPSASDPQPAFQPDDLVEQTPVKELSAPTPSPTPFGPGLELMPVEVISE